MLDPDKVDSEETPRPFSPLVKDNFGKKDLEIDVLCFLDYRQAESKRHSTSTPRFSLLRMPSTGGEEGHGVSPESTLSGSSTESISGSKRRKHVDSEVLLAEVVFRVKHGANIRVQET